MTNEFKVERISIFFEDGLIVTIPEERLNAMMDDVITGRPNQLYKFPKAEHAFGNKELHGTLKMIERFSPANLADS